MEIPEGTPRYLNFMELSLKFACLKGWYTKPTKEIQFLINNVYLAVALFMLITITVDMAISLYTGWLDIMTSVLKIADSFPLLASLGIITYHAVYRREFYDLNKFMDKNFRYHSGNGLTNMTMIGSYRVAKRFWQIYTTSTLLSVSVYAILPVIVHLWTKKPIEIWMYTDVENSLYVALIFFRYWMSQLFVGLAIGQFGVFFAVNSILICGQLDILCCSLRNARLTAMLRCGVRHIALVQSYSDILEDERHNYMYNISTMVETSYHYDMKVTDVSGKSTQFDIYDHKYDAATFAALRECAQLCQNIKEYKNKFEAFVSPLLALRVVQVTLFLCMLLYAATLKFDMVTVEYLAAVTLDIFIYCYYGNQIILQADRVSTAAYQSLWHAMDVVPRRVLLNILLSNKRPLALRAGNFLRIDLNTFIVIIKTSFSYYTLLVNVNEK